MANEEDPMPPLGIPPPAIPFGNLGVPELAQLPMTLEEAMPVEDLVRDAARLRRAVAERDHLMIAAVLFRVAAIGYGAMNDDLTSVRVAFVCVPLMAHIRFFRRVFLAFGWDVAPDELDARRLNFTGNMLLEPSVTSRPELQYYILTPRTVASFRNRVRTVLRRWHVEHAYNDVERSVAVAMTVLAARAHNVIVRTLAGLHSGMPMSILIASHRAIPLLPEVLRTCVRRINLVLVPTERRFIWTIRARRLHDRIHYTCEMTTVFVRLRTAVARDVMELCAEAEVRFGGFTEALRLICDMMTERQLRASPKPGIPPSLLARIEA